MNVNKIARNSLVTIAGVGTLAAVFFGDATFKKGKAMTPEFTGQTLRPTDSIDVTKPNLPLIGKDFIQYRGLDGKINKVVSTEETAAVYNAIAKMNLIFWNLKNFTQKFKKTSMLVIIHQFIQTNLLINKFTKCV